MSGGEELRPIDKVREAARSIQIGGPEDGAVCAMVDMGSSLYIVMQRAIYAVQLADRVDPKRTNIAVPNTQQRILSMGSTNPEVARIFLTANTLFKATYLGKNFPEREARSLAFGYLRDIVAMIELHSSLVAAVEHAVVGLTKVVARDRSLNLPSLGNAEERCEAFTQKVGHAIDTLRAIARLFYPKELSKKWIDALTSLAAQRYGDEAPFARFMRESRDALLLMREIRNMVEHPQEAAYVKVHDFQLSPDMELISPAIEIVRPGEAPPSGTLESFMAQIHEKLLSVGEMFITTICGANVRPFSGFPIVVAEIPPGRRPEWNPHQRISYGIVMNNEVHPLD